MKNLFSTLLSLLFIILILIHNPIQAQWVRTNGPGGGRIYSFTASGDNLFTAGEAGIFISLDNGANWKPSGTGLPENTAVQSLASNGSTLFARSSYNGIYVSTNNGASWAKVTNGLPDLKSGQAGNFAFSGDTVFIFVNSGTKSEIFYSKDNGANWSSVGSGLPENSPVHQLASGKNRLFAATNNGLYRSTDNGFNWHLLDSGITVSTINSIAVKGDTIYAGTEGKFFVSFDGGAGWKQQPVEFGSEHITVLAVKDNYVYAASVDGIPYRSTDNGETWSPATTGLIVNSVLALYIKGDLVFAGTQRGGVFVSSDRALSWSPASKGLNYSWADAMIVKDGILIAGTLSGVYSSSDNGESWNDSNNGLGGALITSFTISGNDILAVSDARIYRSSNNGQSWTSITDNLPETKFNAAAAIGNHIFAGTENGAFLSTDNGANWKSVNNGIKLYEEEIPRVTHLTSFGNIIIAGARIGLYGGGIFLSTDYGANWTVSKSEYGSPFRITGISAVGNKIFIAYTLGFMHYQHAYLSADTGKSWKSIMRGFQPYPEIGNLFVIGNHIYATSEGMYLYSEADSSWGNAAGLFPERVISMVNNEKYIFAGTEEQGIFRRPISEIVILTPDKPQLKSVENNSRNQPLNVYFSWNSVSTADSYQLQVAKDSLFSELVLNDSLIIYPSGYVGGLQNSTTYFWRVRAKNSAGVSPWSEVWKFTTIQALAGAPVLSFPKNSSTDNPLTLTFSWKLNKNTDQYRLIVSEDDKFEKIFHHDSTLTDTLKEVKDLKEGMKYYWKVSSRNSAGDGPFSDVWNFTTLLYAPEGLEATVQGKKKIHLKWKDNSKNETGFVIERKQDQDFVSIDTVKANTTNYKDSLTSQATTFQYRVKAYTQFAVSAYSNTASVTLTGVDEMAFVPKEFRLFQNYPNPFNPVTAISYWLPERSFVELKIFDMLGREVTTLLSEEKDAGEYKLQFNASTLPSGVYIYLIKAGGFRDSKKLILLK